MEVGIGVLLTVLYIFAARGGATVADRAPAERAGVLELARGLADAARRIGMSDDELVALVRASATPASRTS